MSDRKDEDLREGMRQIAMELDSIDANDCTLAESNIAEVLIEYGFMKLLDRGDEVAGWTEYVKT